MESIRRWVEHRYFSYCVLFLIMINAILVGLETYPGFYQRHQFLLMKMDSILLWIFTVEILLRIIAAGSWFKYIRDGWNCFELILVLSGHLFAGTHFISVLRVFRVLRVLRVVSIVPSLRKLVEALLITIPQMGNILFLLGILFYIFGVSGTILFREVSPEYFGSLHRTLLTLFQVVTLEAWASGIMNPMLHKAPWAWVYFILFVLSGTFVVLNLFVGVIVTKVEEVEKSMEPEANVEATLLTRIEKLDQEFQELKRYLMARENGNSNDIIKNVKND